MDVAHGARPLTPPFGKRRMETIAKLSWKSDDEFVEVSSPDEALSVIRGVDVASRARPIGLHVTRPDGENMMIILGSPRSCLVWFPSGYEGIGSQHTVAEVLDPDVDRIPPDPEVITYYFFGHHSEVPREHTVPKETAFQAVQRFLSSPGPPDCVRWEMD